MSHQVDRHFFGTDMSSLPVESLFMHSYSRGGLGCFHVLAVMNADVNGWKVPRERVKKEEAEITQRLHGAMRRFCMILTVDIPLHKCAQSHEKNNTKTQVFTLCDKDMSMYVQWLQQLHSSGRVWWQQKRLCMYVDGKYKISLHASLHFPVNQKLL